MTEAIVIVAVSALALAVLFLAVGQARTVWMLGDQFKELTRQNVSWARGELDRLQIERDIERANMALERAERRTVQPSRYDDHDDAPSAPSGGYDMETLTDSPLRN